MIWQPYFVFALILVAIILFFSGRVRLDLTAAFVILALAVSGVVTPSEAIAGFGDPLVMMIAGLFVVGEGLHRTGVAAWVGQRIATLGRGSEWHLILLLMPTVAILSAFMSSTGVVAIFIPVVLSMARSAGLAARRLLLPLAFASLIGGMLTLIGTPPNLAVSRALVDAGMEGFGFFDFAPIGGAILLVGIVYMLTLGRRLLPGGKVAEGELARRSLHDMAEEYGITEGLHRLQVRAGSLLCDMTVGEVGLRRNFAITVMAVERHGALLTALKPVLIGTRLRQGDELYVVAPQPLIDRHADYLGLSDLGFPSGMRRRLQGQFGMAEALVVPGSPLVGKTVREGNFRNRQGLTVLSIRRADQPMALDFDQTRMEAGDMMLLAGPWEALEQMNGPRRDLVLLELPQEIVERTWHGNQAPWAVLVTFGMLIVMTLQLTSNLVAVMLGAFAMIATRCVSMDEAYRSMNWQSLVLIAGMLPLARALEVTGGSGMMVTSLAEFFHDMGPRAVLGGLFLLTSLFSQFISNTATTVLIAPIALNLALDMGLSPTPFLMTVAIAASTAFATPVASPVNTLILGPGNYRFSDFLKIGVPLQALALIVTLVMVPLIFSVET
ncbi:MAG: SLC13 family permease [Candidatus Thiodiazotropha sp. DIVDIV]